MAHLHMICTITYPQICFYMLEDCNMIEPWWSHSALLCQFSYSSDNDHSLSHIRHLFLNHNCRARQFWRGDSLWIFLTASAVLRKETWILSQQTWVPASAEALITKSWTLGQVYKTSPTSSQLYCMTSQ